MGRAELFRIPPLEFGAQVGALRWQLQRFDPLLRPGVTNQGLGQQEVTAEQLDVVVVGAVFCLSLPDFQAAGLSVLDLDLLVK